jgi:hypothetical protein
LLSTWSAVHELDEDGAISEFTAVKAQLSST